MNIKSFMALAVVALTAACASEDPKAAEGVTVEKAAEAPEAVTEEAAVATAVTEAVDAAPEGEQAR
jgi:hypothetical protein